MVRKGIIFRIIPIIILLFLNTTAGMAEEYNILDFGAVKNEKSTVAIQKAVDHCFEKGGGTVVVPAGNFITGTIVLKSRINLHLQSGAVLEGSLDLDDYISTFRTHGMIFSEDAVDVSITGEGTIHARGIEFYDPTQNHTYPEFEKDLTRQKQDYMPDGEFYTDGPIKRLPKPGMTITFYHCSQVRLKDFILKDTPSWAIRLAYCDDVLVDGISILNNLLIPNSDGIHCTVSRNVRIANCDIRAGDDAIIFTGFPLEENTPGFSGEAQAAHTYGNKSRYAENFSVTNCQLQSRSAGIRVGYGQHPIRRGTFSNIQIYGSNRGIGIFAHDASDIEELIFSNIIIDSRLHNGQWWGNGEPIHISAISRFVENPAGMVKNVTFNHIMATGEHGLIFYGMPDSHLENIRLNDVRLNVVRGKETLTYGGNFDLRPTAYIEKQLFEHDIPGIYAQYVDGFYLQDVTLAWGEDLPDFFTHALQCFQVTGLHIERFEGKANPSCQSCDKLKLDNTTLSDKE
jgi:polygalacturonase